MEICCIIFYSSCLNSELNMRRIINCLFLLTFGVFSLLRGVMSDDESSSFRIPFTPARYQRTPRLLAADSDQKTIMLTGYEGINYIATISIGSTNATFQVLLDTTSSILWVPDIALSTNSSYNKTYFNCNQSTTCTVINEDNISLSYGVGEVEVYLAKDNVYFENVFEVTNLSIGLAVSIENLEGMNADGILGLGFSNQSNVPTFLDLLYQEGKINNRMFSLYLSDNIDGGIDMNSELIINGFDSKKMNGTSFSYLKTAGPNEWSLQLMGLNIGNVSIPFNFEAPKASLATSRAYIAFPAPIVSDIVNILRNNYSIECAYDQKNPPRCSCGSGTTNFPPLVLGFLDDTTTDILLNLTVVPDEYVSYAGSYCEIQISTIGSFETVWPLGNNFLRNYYVMFNVDNSSIGFANLTRIPITKLNPLDFLYAGIVILIALLMVAFWVLVVRNTVCKKRVGRDSDFHPLQQSMSEEEKQ